MEYNVAHQEHCQSTQFLLCNCCASIINGERKFPLQVRGGNCPPLPPLNTALQMKTLPPGMYSLREECLDIHLLPGVNGHFYLNILIHQGVTAVAQLLQLGPYTPPPIHPPTSVSVITGQLLQVHNFLLSNAVALLH
jgi:hypothetical protein